MADVSKVKLPNNTVVNIKDSRIPGVDTEPTSGSDNVVTSGGVYDSIQSAIGSGITIYDVEPDTSTAGTWKGTSSEIESLYDGLTIRYKVPIAGASTTTLNVNNLGAKTVYRAGSTKLTTNYAVGSYILLYYSSLNGGCWEVYSDYDANSYSYVRQYQAGSNAAGTAPKYPLLARYNVTNKNGSYDTAYSRYHTGATLDTSTGELEATSFVKTGGTSSQFLKADGSVDSNTYATTNQIPTVDATPTSGSTNAVSSGGVYSAIEASNEWDALEIDVNVDEFYDASVDGEYQIEYNSQTKSAFASQLGITSEQVTNIYEGKYRSLKVRITSPEEGEDWVQLQTIPLLLYSKDGDNQPQIVYGCGTNSPFNISFHSYNFEIENGNFTIHIGSGSEIKLNLQEKLYSGTNIKTINNESILGSGNITISGGGAQVQSDWEQNDNTQTDYIKNRTHYLTNGTEKELLASGGFIETNGILGTTLKDTIIPTSGSYNLVSYNSVYELKETNKTSAKSTGNFYAIYRKYASSSSISIVTTTIRIEFTVTSSGSAINPTYTVAVTSATCTNGINTEQLTVPGLMGYTPTITKIPTYYINSTDSVQSGNQNLVTSSGVYSATQNFVPKSGTTEMSNDAELVFPSEDWNEQSNVGFATKISRGGVHCYDPDDFYELHMDPTDGVFLAGYPSGGNTQYGCNFIYNKINSSTGYSYYFPNKGGTFAMTSDIPNLSNYVSKDGGSMNPNKSLTFTEGDLFYNIIKYDGIQMDNDDDGFYVEISSSGPYFKISQGASQNIFTKYTQRNIEYRDVDNSSASPFVLSFPEGSGTLALTSDIPSLSGYVEGSKLGQRPSNNMANVEGFHDEANDHYYALPHTDIVSDEPQIINYILATTDQIPTKTSDLTNDSGFKKITISSSEPTSSDGVNGDIWIVI